MINLKSLLIFWCKKILFAWLPNKTFKVDDEFNEGFLSKKPPKNSLRQWLLENNYEDVAEIIEKILMEWKRESKATRRTWWDVLAGDKNGNPRKIEGIELPVLRAAQIRQGKQITGNALCRNEEEKLPQTVRGNRWQRLRDFDF